MLGPRLRFDFNSCYCSKLRAKCTRIVFLYFYEIMKFIPCYNNLEWYEYILKLCIFIVILFIIK